ncbi:glycosyltransferase [Turicibacter bilis]|uniref:Glycosyltransferase n=1 Tax=Turicibacter bilis TaxID=2735723 RepID=A0A9Q9CF20_9FIRM|nr:glycosyltransferase family 2 protein [Turicibacter bilis]MBS3197074.1 glycosyltransferase [Turicibacter bilis]MBS3199814.1 glycosyltransferase [Turicibacter bilis]UUF06212.1 glycosyltransferase [Turicibacter bilis]UUF07455.1 glycosyltransferase [Turicibacter bilis]
MLEFVVDSINYFFMIYIVIYAIIFFISTISSIIELEKNRVYRKYEYTFGLKSEENSIPISILVPAYNESQTIIDCIESNIYLDYPEFEIIVINDGSTDEMGELVRQHFKLKEINRPIKRVVPCQKEISIYEGKIREGINLILINKVNGGKADALNMGINVAKYPLIVCLDADSVLQYDSLSEIIVSFMKDSRTIAVGGNVKVSNQVVLDKGRVIEYLSPKKFIVMMQLIEYYRVFLNTRVWFNQFNGNLIISGAFGLFRKDAVIAVGGYDTNSVGEDMDLVLRLHSFYRKNQLPYRIGYEPRAICWSQVPSSLKDIKNQRRRWQIGLMTSLFNHRYMAFNFHYGFIGLFSYSYFIVYEMLSCLVDIFGLIFIMISYFTGFLNFSFFITFMLIYIIYNMVISIVAIKCEEFMFQGSLSFCDKMKLILFSIIENFGYHQLLSFYRLSAFIGYRQQKHQWKKINRVQHNKLKPQIYKT